MCPKVHAHCMRSLKGKQFPSSSHQGPGNHDVDSSALQGDPPMGAGEFRDLTEQVESGLLARAHRPQGSAHPDTFGEPLLAKIHVLSGRCASVSGFCQAAPAVTGCARRAAVLAGTSGPISTDRLGPSTLSSASSSRRWAHTGLSDAVGRWVGKH